MHFKVIVTLSQPLIVLSHPDLWEFYKIVASRNENNPICAYNCGLIADILKSTSSTCILNTNKMEIRTSVDTYFTLALCAQTPTFCKKSMTT